MRNNDPFFSVFGRRADAAAMIRGSERYPTVQGSVLFYQLPGGVVVRAELRGLPRGSWPCGTPIFAFHIHSGGSCTGTEDDPFAAAGMHDNPYDCPHPYHAGDLPPLFGVNGSAFSAFLTGRFTVEEVLGKTVIVHDSPDDFTTQPSGNAGEKIACGVITPTARQEPPPVPPHHTAPRE